MSTSARVLPWRRYSQLPADEIADLVDAYLERHTDGSADRIKQAFELASGLHDGQSRKSGESYIHHPIAVATIVARLGLDDTTIIAALLHDAVEDTHLTLEDLEEQFDADVAMIVDGVTKLERVHFDSKEAQQSASMRKMMVAIAKDVRVIIIKLSDRLHNMQTIAALPEWKQQRTAQETIDIYAPLAHRLGMQELKTQLEDLTFATLHPKRYSEIDQMVHVRAPEREIFLAQIVGDVQARMEELGINAEVTGRPKHLFSIYEKMVVKGRSFEEIYDLVGIRVIVENVRDAYAALGSIHSAWKPVQGRFKDYIAMPKFNLYQSLHTTVVGPMGKPLEVQIRTFEMHARAEHGVAAHWDYKDAAPSSDLDWLNRIVDWQEETSDPTQFLANLKFDLDQDEIFLFTPAGEVITLPVGATPIDFAYAIHTEVGHACVGARVNQRLVALESRLESGDTVEVITSKNESAGPSQDWLKFVATHRAANKIRGWYSKERREDAIEHGREELLAELRRASLPVKEVQRDNTLTVVAEALNYADADAMYAAIGQGHVSAGSVATRVEREFSPDEDDITAGERIPTKVLRPRQALRYGAPGVHVEGIDDVMVRLSRCCTPVPPDEIMGFITRGRGVSVHRADCANAVALQEGQAERLIDVDWDEDVGGAFVASVEVKALDRAYLLRDISAVLAEHNVNIISCNTVAGSDRVAKMRFEFDLGDSQHLIAVMRYLREIDSVYDVYRVLPGAS